MKSSEHKRVKHGQLPGDISRRGKIIMREGSRLAEPLGLDGNRAKTYNRQLYQKSKTVQRRRDQQAIKEAL